MANVARPGEANACLVFSSGRWGVINARRGGRYLQAGITRDEPGREQQEINLYAVLRKEPNWSGGNRTRRLKRFVGYTLPRESRRHARQICPHGEANACLFFSSGLISLESVKNAGVPLLASVTTVEYLQAAVTLASNHDLGMAIAQLDLTHRPASSVKLAENDSRVT